MQIRVASMSRSSRETWYCSQIRNSVHQIGPPYRKYDRQTSWPLSRDRSSWTCSLQDRAALFYEARHNTFHVSIILFTYRSSGHIRYPLDARAPSKWLSMLMVVRKMTSRLYCKRNEKIGNFTILSSLWTNQPSGKLG